MNSIDLSIIVPVYNTSLYLRRCINSLLNLELLKYEVILVNDGSTDDSEQICLEYSSKYDWIYCYSQANQGVAVARNNGIGHARGKYITFVDSDDYWSELDSASLVSVLSSGCDLVYNTAYFRDVNGKISTIRKERVSLEGDLFNNILRENKTGGWANWLYVFKTKIIKDNNICYVPKVRVAEDAEFFFKYCKYVNSVSFYDFPYYVYIAERPKSAMNSGRGRALLSFWDLIQYRLTNSNDEKDERINSILVLNFLGWVGYSYLLNGKEKKTLIENMSNYSVASCLDKDSSDYIEIMKHGYKFYVLRKSVLYLMVAIKNDIGHFFRSLMNIGKKK